MGFYWVKTNRLIKTMFPNYVWDQPCKGKKVYLTFDDGPTPEITQWVLSELEAYSAKATFFCIGNNIEKHPQIFNKVVEAGHAIGNHTFNHLNGWKTQTFDYFRNVEQCAAIIGEMTGVDTVLFRPPYGRIKKAQARHLIEKGYKIVMWDVLSADFDAQISPEKCLQNVIQNVRPGSIIIFHDSVKGSKNLRYALPRTLAFLKENGFDCEALS